ncbi:MAG: branched-chain amino acid ABC transporter substrate-binding protein [Planctomycetaceae bacterium]
MQHRRWAALVGLVALAVVATACSNSSSTSASSGSSSSASGAADCNTSPGCVTVAAGAPIEIGTLLATTGATKNLGLDSLYGVELAVDYYDGAFDGNNGQIDGHDIKLVNESDGCSADGGQKGATTLAADPQLVGVIGTSCSSASLGVADKIFSDKGITIISPSATNPALTTEGTHQPYYFRTAHNDRIQAAVDADFATQYLKAKTAVTIHDESPYTQGLTDGFKANFAGSVLSEEAVNSSDTDFKALLAKIAQNPPNVLYAPDFNPVCAQLVKQMKDTSGLENTVYVGADGCSDTSFTQIAGDAANGSFLSGPDLTAFSGGDFYQNEFLPAYKKLVGSSPISVFHAHAFDAMNILMNAIKSAAVQNPDGSLTISRVAVRDAVQNTQNYQGVIGTLSCTPLGDCATSVTIGVYEVPKVGFLDPSAKPVFTETKTLADVK